MNKLLVSLMAVATVSLFSASAFAADVTTTPEKVVVTTPEKVVVTHKKVHHVKHRHHAKRHHKHVRHAAAHASEAGNAIAK